MTLVTTGSVNFFMATSWNCPFTTEEWRNKIQSEHFDAREGEGERVITISFPVFSSDRNINIIRDNWISGKSGGGAEAGGRSVKSIQHKKLSSALEGGHSALK